MLKLLKSKNNLIQIFSWILIFSLKAVIIYPQSKVDIKRLNIFPEGEVGNAVYLNDAWLYSNENQQIYSGIFNMRFNIKILWIEQEDNKKFVVLPTEERNPEFRNIQPNVILFNTPEIRMIVIATIDNELESFYFNFNSVRNFIENNQKQIAFNHLAKIERDEISGKVMYQYRFHIYSAKNKSLQTLSDIIVLNQEVVNLTWDNLTLLATLRDNNKLIITTVSKDE